MYQYEGSSEQTGRLNRGECRCASRGDVYCLAQLLSDGRILEPALSVPLSTPPIRKGYSNPIPAGGGINKTFIFAINEHFQIHVARDGHRPLRNAVKHETLFHNADVLAAGEISIQDGIITDLNDLSGSYKTEGELEVNPDFSAAILNTIAKHNLPVSPELQKRLRFYSKVY